MVASWEYWDAGSIPGLAQWVKDLVLLQLQYKSQLWLESDPWPRISICHRVAKKKKKKKFLPSRNSHFRQMKTHTEEEIDNAY